MPEGVTSPEGVTLPDPAYHVVGKDDLANQVVHQAAEQAEAYIRSRILAESTGPGMLRPTSNRRLPVPLRASRFSSARRKSGA